MSWKALLIKKRVYINKFVSQFDYINTGKIYVNNKDALTILPESDFSPFPVCLKMIF